MSPRSVEDILWIINWGILPGESRSRGDLPIEVETWMMATKICLDALREEVRQ